MQYELFYLVGASKEAELDKIKAEVAALITSEGGVFEEKQVVEKRKMAYEVKHENRGFYVAQRFNLEDATAIQAITRKLNLYGNILRSLVVRTEELPELTSREEREAKATRETKKPSAAQTARPTATEKVAPAKMEETKTEKIIEKTPAEKKIDEEDIDKKLEEILNI